MGIQKRGDTKITPNHALDTIGNPSEACLPISRPSLTRYALEYNGALRMIRVSVLSNDLMTRVICLGVVGANIYRPERPT